LTQFRRDRKTSKGRILFLPQNRRRPRSSKKGPRKQKTAITRQKEVQMARQREAGRKLKKNEKKKKRKNCCRRGGCQESFPTVRIGTPFPAPYWFGGGQTGPVNAGVQKKKGVHPKNGPAWGLDRKPREMTRACETGRDKVKAVEPILKLKVASGGGGENGSQRIGIIVRGSPV